jgi:hypothetical protein
MVGGILGEPESTEHRSQHARLVNTGLRDCTAKIPRFARDEVSGHAESSELGNTVDAGTAAAGV